VHANKAVQNTVEQNKVGGEDITGEDILRRRGRLDYDRGETLLRLKGETFSWWRLYYVTGQAGHDILAVALGHCHGIYDMPKTIPTTLTHLKCSHVITHVQKSPTTCIFFIWSPSLKAVAGPVGQDKLTVALSNL